MEPLIKVLRDEDSGVQVRASEALVMIGKPAVEPLIEALRERTREILGTLARVDQSLRKQLTVAFKVAVVMPQNIWRVFIILLSGAGLLIILIVLAKKSNSFQGIRILKPGWAALFGLCSSFSISIFILSVVSWESYFLFNAVPRLSNLFFMIIMPIVIYVTLFIVAIVILSNKWDRAKHHAKSFFCTNCFTRRFVLGKGLPWIVRWSGRHLAREIPAEYENFPDYFICKNCRGKWGKVEVVKVIGLIGGNVQNFKMDEDRIYFNHWSESEKKTRNADIDILEIRNTNGISYDYAINAVWTTLKNDVSRSKSLKAIPVVLHGNPPISEGSRRILENEFGGIMT